MHTGNICFHFPECILGREGNKSFRTLLHPIIRIRMVEKHAQPDFPPFRDTNYKYNCNVRIFTSPTGREKNAAINAPRQTS